jgi:N utilization substance protein A
VTGSDIDTMKHLVDDLADRALTRPPSRLVTVTVVEASADIAVCQLPDNRIARLPVTAFYPNRTWEVGGRYILALSEHDTSLHLSATDDALVAMLFDGVSPEVREGRVRVMGVARHVGVRSKVAVAATEPGVDPVGACLGRAANRVRSVSAFLLGERVDVVAYHPDPQRFLVNALAVSPLSVSFEGDEAGYVVVVPSHQLAAARGGGNLNVVLASRLCGQRIELRGER